jgi:hypothetical protein
MYLWTSHPRHPHPVSSFAELRITIQGAPPPPLDCSRSTLCHALLPLCMHPLCLKQAFTSLDGFQSTPLQSTHAPQMAPPPALKRGVYRLEEVGTLEPLSFPDLDSHNPSGEPRALSRWAGFRMAVSVKPAISFHWHQYAPYALA